MRVLLLLAAFLLPSVCYAQTANELLSRCEAVERESKIVNSKLNMPRQSEGWGCVYYMEAVSAIGGTRVKDKQFMLPFCPPNGSDVLQYIRIFTAYARKNPAELHYPAQYTVISALLEAFPCK